jgi:hypothetical protein
MLVVADPALPGFIAMNPSHALLIARMAVAVCALVLTACGREPPPAPAKGPVDVTVLTIQRADVPVTAVYVAQTQSVQAVNIQARVSGWLDKPGDVPAVDTLREHCIDGTTANEGRTRDMVLNSLWIVTPLKSVLGYKQCAEIARERYESGKSLHDVVVKERKLLTQEKWNEVFAFDNLISPKFEQ